MSALPADAEELIALGAFTGAQVLVVCLSAVIAVAYRERALLIHAAGTMMGVLSVQSLVGDHPFLAQATLLLVLAFNGMQLRDVMSHAGALREPRRWLVAVSLVVLPLLALADYFARWHLLLPGLALWIVIASVVMLRTWPQSQPWARWLLPGQVALAAGVAWLGWRSLDSEPDPALPLAAMLTLWSVTIFLATAWRNRIFGETRLRIDARNTVDPLTGLLSPIIFYDRVGAVRTLSKRYGHPSVLLLVHIDNLGSIQAEFGPEVAESALLVAANRIREALRDGDVAARLSHSRIGVLAEGMSAPVAASNLATRILVAGLKEPLPAAPSEFLHFRMVLAAVPITEMTPKALMQKMSVRLDAQVAAPTERRIVILGADELGA